MKPGVIINPVLPGFNPDPSICRVGEDYYIATSTFEWFPGVQIHHSRDLVNWQLVTRPLRRASQLDMRGNPDSGGIWAPCLSHADGRFWLVYTDVKRWHGNFQDTHNYIVTCDTIDGDWSDPVYVNSSGFDPTLFHDDDGRKWFANMRWNHRGPGSGCNPAHHFFDGILLQEWSPDRGLFGPVKNIYCGTDLGLSEGPHLFKRNGWYYLTVAEGGTGYNHAVTMARSRDIWGPYETHPQKHLLFAGAAPGNPLQKTGHGQYFETPDGVPYHTFLTGRPLDTPDRACPLGRETGLARCVWKEDGWLYLAHGGTVANLEVPAPDPAAVKRPHGPIRRDFRDGPLPPEFQWLRTPHPERLFHFTGSSLRLTGRESLGSFFEQSLVSRRQEDFRYRAETRLDFSPVTYQQAAGLATYYNRHKYHFAGVTHEEGYGRCLTIISSAGDWPDAALTYPLAEPEPLVGGPVELAVEVDHARQQFYWRQDGMEWQKLGPVMDASLISDEGSTRNQFTFTGAFAAMVAFDITGQGAPADFDWFSYMPE